MAKIVQSCLSALVFFSLFGCDSGPQIMPGGYLKTAAKDRIFTCRLPDGATFEDFKSYAKGRAHTEGQMTAVYCYEPDAVMPVDIITEAGDIMSANARLNLPALSDWRFAYMRYRDGTEEFADCSAVQASELCRDPAK